MQKVFADTDLGAPTVESLLNQRHWSAVVLEDDERYAASNLKREDSIRALQDLYLPEILNQQEPSESNRGTNTTILLLETFSYQSVRNRRQVLRLHTFEEMTRAIQEGYEIYADALRDESFPVRIVPVAAAVEFIFDNDNYGDLWEAIYSDDPVHPSPHGTWLMACLLVTTATGRDPPAYDRDLHLLWWKSARHWATMDQGGMNQRLPLPTQEEAETLMRVACLQILKRDCRF